MKRLIRWLERRHHRNALRYATTHRSSCVTTKKEVQP